MICVYDSYNCLKTFRHRSRLWYQVHGFRRIVRLIINQPFKAKVITKLFEPLVFSPLEEKSFRPLNVIPHHDLYHSLRPLIISGRSLNWKIVLKANFPSIFWVNSIRISPLLPACCVDFLDCGWNANDFRSLHHRTLTRYVMAGETGGGEREDDYEAFFTRWGMGGIAMEQIESKRV